MDIVAILTSPIAGIIETSLGILLVIVTFGIVLSSEDNEHAVNEKTLKLLRTVSYISLFLCFLDLTGSMFFLVIAEMDQFGEGIFGFAWLSLLTGLSTCAIGIFVAIQKSWYDRFPPR